MKVVAKFRLWEKAERAPSWTAPTTPDAPKPEQEPRIAMKFSAVKDAVFGPYTPSGSLEMTVIASVGEHFKLGQEYRLTFEPFE